MKLRKYPRTPHIDGSRLQPGDDLGSISFTSLENRFIVLEEKIDGANAALSFDRQGQLQLQSRGHFLTGGPREKHFTLFKRWANHHRSSLYSLLGKRYLIFGEWVYAKHTIYYDRLSHYFLEFDIYDREYDHWLDTPRRHRLLAESPIVSVPVIKSGPAQQLGPIDRWVTQSQFKSNTWRKRLDASLRAQGRAESIWRETDPSDLMEGLYIKVESEGKTVGRYKWVRHDFLTRVEDSGTHWLQRPIIPNQLDSNINLFS